MKREINIFFNALLFYSRIRVPKGVECTEQTLSQALRYFPLVGLIVGGVGAIVLWLFSLLLPLSSSVVMALIAMILTTGAFHEDGLADFTDGFGAGCDREAILRIMKDSHIGTYGVLALITSLLLKFSLITSLGDLERIIFAIVAAQGASRFISVLMLSSTPYVSGKGSKSTHASLGVNYTNVAVAALFGALPAILFEWQSAVLYLPLATLCIVIFRNYSLRKIGGCTGDVLGATQQIAELLYYMVLIAVQTLQL